MTSKPLKIFMSAGEASGDVHGAQLISSMKSLTDCDFVGMGGPAMVAAGLRQIKDISDMQVMGFIEVIKNIGHFRRIFKQMEARMAEEKPDMVLLVDYPGFNLRLAKSAKKMGLKTVLYVAPQVWAWRQNRAKRLAPLIDHLLVLFRFEVDFFKNCHPNVHFIGHPLLDEIDAGSLDAKSKKLKARLEIDPESKIIALLPGSRENEIKLLMPIYWDAVKLLSQILENKTKISVLIARAASSQKSPVWNTWEEMSKNETSFKSHILDEPASVVTRACHAAAVSSGTATLETAIAGAPMVVCYKANPISIALARQIVDTPVIGLVNIVSGKPVCPELIQEDLTGEAVASLFIKILTNGDVNSEIKKNLHRVHTILGEAGSSARASQIILEAAKS